MTQNPEGIGPDALAAMMNLSLHAVVTQTRQGMITGWNPYAAELYGYQPEEIIGRDATVLLPLGWHSEEADLLRRVGAGERITPYNTNRVRKDGSLITVLMSVSATVNPAGSFNGVLTSSRLATTITGDSQIPPEDHERPRAQLDLEGLGQLAGGVAHEFNNLIGVILNYAALVGEEIDTATTSGAEDRWRAAADDVGEIRRAAERAAGLTRQLLSFARREVVQPQVVDFNNLLPVTTQAADTPPSRDTAAWQTVLIVEDEEALREVTRRLLTRQGYTVITAGDGAEALDAASVHPGDIDLLLTDVMMPQMLGKEAAERIRQIRPDIRVLYMSGYAQPILASQGRLGLDVTLLDKPFTERELLDKVHTALTPQTVARRA